MNKCIAQTLLIVRMVTLVGLAQSALAQPATSPSEKRGQPQTAPQTTQGRGAMDDRDMRRNMMGDVGMDFRSASWLKGRDVVNANDEDLGDVTDLIIERGSGRVKYVVIKTGTTLGMGGRSVVMPYKQLSWSGPKGRFVLMSGATELNAYPEFNDERWDSLRMSQYPEPGRATDMNQPSDRTRTGNDGPDTRPSTPSSTQSQEGNRDAAGTSVNPGTVSASGRTTQDTSAYSQDNRGASQDRPRNFNDWMWNESYKGGHGDVFSSNWSSAGKERIQGEVKSVSRERSPHGEDVVVEVAAQDGSTKKVNIGPAWFVSGGEASINRGDKIALEVVPLYVATSTTVNGREVKLRDEKGSGVWGGRSFTMGKDNYSMPYYRHVRLTKLNGANLDCRGAACGKINDVIIETNSGSIAFLSIDPNQNFLGIADTKRMVPWSVATVAVDGTVRIDASKDMVLASPETPSDLASLNGAGRTDSIYNAFQVTPRRAEDYRESYQMGDDSSWNRSDWNSGSDRNNSGMDRNRSGQGNPNNSNPNSNTSDPKRDSRQPGDPK